MGDPKDILEIQAWVDGEASPELARELERSNDARRAAESLRRLRVAFVGAETREAHPVPLASDLEVIKRRVLQSESRARDLSLQAQSLADGILEGRSENLDQETRRHAERIRDLSRLLRENPPMAEVPVAPEFYMAGIRSAIESPKTAGSRVGAWVSDWLNWVRAPQFASALASLVALLLVAGQLHRAAPTEIAEEMEVIYVAGASDFGMQPVFWIDDRPRREGAVY